MNRLLAAVFAMPLMVIAASFEENRGQTDSRIRYLVHEPAGTVFFTADSVAVRPRGADANIEWTLAGSKPDAPFHLEEQTGRRRTYKVGRDPSHWVENLPSYSRLRRSEIYPGIDIVYRTVADQRNGLPLEYDFIVQPGADPSIIRIRFAEGSRVEIAANGSLEIESGGSRISHRAPVAYQETGSGRQEVPARFRRVAEREFAFDTGAYDRSRTLVIDPELLTFTRFGGSGDDVLVGNRSRYPLHSTDSLEFTPWTGVRTRSRNLYIAHYAINSGMVETIIGGAGDETPLAIDWGCDTLIIVGRTTSRDLPTAPAAAQREYGGGESDGFVLAITSFGSRAISYWGGSGRDQLTSVAGCTIAGQTDSPDLPGLSISGQKIRGGSDIAVSRLSSLFPPAFAEPLLMGGADDDLPNAMTRFGAGKLLLVGETRSRDFPRYNNEDPIRGPSDAFWMVLSSTFGKPEVEHSRTYGGLGRDRLMLVEPTAGTAESPEAPLVMAGASDSPDLPAVPAATGSRGGGADLFALWVSAPSWTPTRRFVWGGSGDEDLAGLTAARGRIFLTGSTTSRNIPLRNPAQARYGGGPFDGFALILDATATVSWATYFGGEGRDVLLSPRDGTSGGYLAPGLLEVTGWSDSSDWSELNKAEGVISRPLGGIDSFTARLSTEPGPVIGPVFAAPGVLAPVDVVLPRGPDPASRIRLSIVESELGALTTDPLATTGSATVEVSGASSGAEAWMTTSRPGSEITVRAEAPGLPPSIRKVRVGSLRVKAIGPLLQFVAPFRETVELEIAGEDGPVPFEMKSLPRRVPPPIVVAEIMTPDTVRFAKGGVRQTVELGQPFDFEGIQPGPLKIRFHVEGFEASESHLEGEIVQAAPSLGDAYGSKDEMTVTPGPGSLRVQCSPDPRAAAPRRIESLNPSVLQFGPRADALSPVVSPNGIFVQAHALRPGTSRLAIDCLGTDGRSLRLERTLRVRALALLPSTSVRELVVGETANTAVRFELTTRGPTQWPVGGFLTLPAGVEVVLRFRAIDPDIVRLGFDQVTLSGRDGRADLLLTGLRAGSTIIETTATGAALGDPVTVRTEIRVVPARRPIVIETGKGFISGGTIPLRTSEHRVPVTMTVADPSVAGFFTTAGPIASLQTEAYSGSLSLGVVGVADRGETQVRVEPEGMEPFDVTVRVRPVSLVLFNGTGYRGSEMALGSETYYYVIPVTIDPETRLPSSSVHLYVPERSEPPPLGLALTGSSVALVNSPRVGGAAGFRAVRPGETMITVEQMEGTVDSVLSTVRVPVVIPKPAEQRMAVAAGGQAAIPIYSPLAPGRYTARSNDPSRIILSSSTGVKGAAERTFEFPSSTSIASFAQSTGLTGSAGVDLLRDGEILVRYLISIRPAVWQWEQRSLTMGAGRATGVSVVWTPDLEPPRAPFAFTTSQQGSILGLGVSARLEIRSANPAIARVRTSEVTVTGPARAYIDFEAVSPGETELIVTDTATQLSDRIRIIVTP